jgi:HPt (histidine-containing phosphotransfer) domain-containing protein
MQTQDIPLPAGRSKYVDLTNLNERTRDNRELILEMITIYLKQTPPLISQMKQGLHDKDWDSVYTAAHKLIPSFSIMGIPKDFEDIAKKIQEYSGTQNHLDQVRGLVLQLENVCDKTYKELEGELIMMEKST